MNPFSKEWAERKIEGKRKMKLQQEPASRTSEYRLSFEHIWKPKSTELMKFGFDYLHSFILPSIMKAFSCSSSEYRHRF